MDERGAPVRRYTAAALQAAMDGRTDVLLYEPTRGAGGQMVIKVSVDPALMAQGAPPPPAQPGPPPRARAEVVRYVPTPPARALAGTVERPGVSAPPRRFRLEPWQKIGAVSVVVLGVLGLCGFGAMRFVDALATSAGSALGAALPALLGAGVLALLVLVLVRTAVGRATVEILQKITVR